VVLITSEISSDNASAIRLDRLPSNNDNIDGFDETSKSVQDKTELEKDNEQHQAHISIQTTSLLENHEWQPNHNYQSPPHTDQRNANGSDSTTNSIYLRDHLEASNQRFLDSRAVINLQTRLPGDLSYEHLATQETQASTTSIESFQDDIEADPQEDRPQLQRWAYETYNTNLTLAEMLERTGWEERTWENV